MMTNVTTGWSNNSSPTRTLLEFYLCSSLFCCFQVIQYLWLQRYFLADLSLFPYVTRTICSKLAGQAKVKAPERLQKNTRHKCRIHDVFFCFGKTISIWEIHLVSHSFPSTCDISGPPCPILFFNS